MTGVEDVAGAAAVAAQDVAGALGHDLPRCEAHGGIEVALDGLARRPVASYVEVDAPVDPHHVGTRRAHERQQLAGPDTEVYAWHPGGLHGGEHLRAGRQHEVLVDVGGEGAGPRVEELDRAGSGVDLGEEGGDGHVGQPVEELAPKVRLGVHHRLRVPVGPRRCALDQVDRNSVVYGKSVSVRVDLGGRRIIKKKTHLNLYINNSTNTIPS